MRFSQSELENVIQSIVFTKKMSNLMFHEDEVSFDIFFDFEGLSEAIEFTVKIKSVYPLRIGGGESISFYLKDEQYKKYSHVMLNNAVCFHNQHNHIFEEKIRQDFSAIQQWIIRYIIDKEKDEHYEHLIKGNYSHNNEYFSFQFTEVSENFIKNELGTVSLLHLRDSRYEDKNIHNYLVQGFLNNLTEKKCKWSPAYLNGNNNLTGVYLFIEESPAKYDRFSFSNWLEFQNIFTQEILSELWQILFSLKTDFVPFFIGFYTKDEQIHWQVAIVDYPISFFKISNEGDYKLQDQKINWVISENSSYEYFFGRGAFSPKLADKKILIIGVGAIGSQVAVTLVRGGCKNIAITDYDVKKPENICRSEYTFSSPYSNKVEELANLLINISPFINVEYYYHYWTELIKDDALFENEWLNTLDEFDYIFDCSTDDDLMFVLDKLDLKGKLFNLSITNHANELVCGISPNSYYFIQHQFKSILQNDVTNMYNPIGCWNPTFKASYNDISILVQMALKHIHKMIIENSYSHFVIHYDEQYNLEIKKF